MKILIIDANDEVQNILRLYLRQAGYRNIASARNVQTGKDILGLVDPSGKSGHCDVDVVLLDIDIPNNGGIELCQRLKNESSTRDISVVMITDNVNEQKLASAFAVGATDYITKPFIKYLLLARVKAAMRLKNEIDYRRQQAKSLEKISNQLQGIMNSIHNLDKIDAITTLYNRSFFYTALAQAHKVSLKEKHSIAVLMLDIDYFGNFAQHYGAQAADNCLFLVTEAIHEVIKDPEEIAARHGADEMVILLQNADINQARKVAEKIRLAVLEKKIRNRESDVHEYVTVSIGLSSLENIDQRPAIFLVQTAEDALDVAKNCGRNQVKTVNDFESKNVEIA